VGGVVAAAAACTSSFCELVATAAKAREAESFDMGLAVLASFSGSVVTSLPMGAHIAGSLAKSSTAAATAAANLIPNRCIPETRARAMRRV
jgi:hypothetical protein